MNRIRLEVESGNIGAIEFFQLQQNAYEKAKEMERQQIIERLNQIEKKIDEQNLLKKDVLTFNDTCKYLELSASHLYKLTSQKDIPHYCPRGKKLYFNRHELDLWLQNK